jgi:hypothetical protein
VGRQKKGSARRPREGLRFSPIPHGAIVQRDSLRAVVRRNVPGCFAVTRPNVFIRSRPQKALDQRHRYRLIVLARSIESRVNCEMERRPPIIVGHIGIAADLQELSHGRNVGVLSREVQGGPTLLVDPRVRIVAVARPHYHACLTPENRDLPNAGIDLWGHFEPLGTCSTSWSNPRLADAPRTSPFQLRLLLGGHTLEQPTNR